MLYFVVHLCVYYRFYFVHSIQFLDLFCSYNIDCGFFFLQNSRISTVRHALNSLTSSAARLQEECQDTNMGDLEPELDLPFKTQQVMQCAFDIARAAKELVTLFQWECSKDALNERSDGNTVRGPKGSRKFDLVPNSTLYFVCQFLTKVDFLPSICCFIWNAGIFMCSVVLMGKNHYFDKILN